ncbi:MAG TPA: SbcC/MukB-like Walker B domain-containing protein, partial [Bacilli bacterium]|nr:SbcC/MukB-like Walker B domain-containing protein [Bacilli bacterium]
EYKALNLFFTENYPNKFKFFDSNRQYQEAIKREFGGLKDKYFSLFKKAVSFTPITDITTFITEYVCDPQKNIDIVPMQDNILQYKKLEEEAIVMRRRVERLDAISSAYHMYDDHRKNMRLFEYIIEKATYQNDKNRLDSYYSQIKKAKDRLLEIDVDLSEVEANIADLNRRKMRLIQDSATSDTFRITDELREQEKVTREKIALLEHSQMEIASNLDGYVANFINASQAISNVFAKFDLTKIDDNIRYELEDLNEASAKVLHASLELRDTKLHDLKSVNTNDLNEWREKLSVFKQRVSAMVVSLNRIIQEAEREAVHLRQQEIDLQHGGKPYERSLVQIRTELQNLLSTKHGKSIRVDFFADLIDIKNEKWTNAIEGIMSSQRFNMFVEGQYYLEAYEFLKALLEKYRFYGTTLVDQDRIIERNYRPDKNSLAEEILTDHLGAEAYVNFLVGRLQKCKTPQEARNSGNGITPECDIYRSFSMGRLNPRSYSPGFFGREVEQATINAKKAEIAAFNKTNELYRELFQVVNSSNRLEIINSNEITNTNNMIVALRDLSPLKSTLDYVQGELKKHDLSQLEGLNKRIELVEEDIKGLEVERSTLFEEKGKLKTTIDSLNQDRIPEAQQIVREREAKLQDGFDVFFVDEEAEPHFTKLISEGKSPLDINTEYRVKFGHAQYLVNNIFSQLNKLRKEYVLDYRLTYDTNMTDNAIYDDELNDMKEVKLPSYEAKIHDAYQKAVKQFRNDFISKLRSAIETVEDQIEDLNQALSASTFGNDSYRFTVKPSSVYRTYYDMIKDDLLLKVGEDDSEFLNKYDEVMKNLFAQIVLAGEGDKNSQVLANVEKFTDYRNYLDFDLLVKDKGGNEQRLSKMLKKKSGGETQTPFYISVLASFAQLYRVNESGELSNSARIIIFDEAFSKMDGGRIKESIKLLRKFGLQAILSAPSDKVADISELVDETLVVLRGRNASHVHLYAKEENIS